MALSGPVLRIPGPGDPSATPSSAISERCFLIALGVPYLREPFDETVRAMVTDASPFLVSWKPQDGGVATACARAMGDDWRPPTLEETRSAFEMRALSTLSVTSVLVHNEREIMSVTFEPKSSPGCRAREPGCDWHVEFQTYRERAGILHCVGPASRLPAVEPSDAEIQQCVRQATSEAARLAPSVVGVRVSGDELDLVFAMRRVCRTQSVTEFETIAKRLRDSTGGVPLHWRAAELERTLAHANAGHLIAQNATSEGDGDAASANCAELRGRYEKFCHAESCLWAQARYAERCLGSNPTEKIQRLAGQLGVRVTSLSEELPRLRTRIEVSAKVARCAKDPAISRRFSGLLGERPAASVPAPECICPIEDLDCGISLLLDPEKCPSSSQNVRTPGACGCAENDLACAMKCAE